MKIVIYCRNYPNENNIYSNMFVHQRAKEYQKKLEDVNLIVFSPYNDKNIKNYEEYYYEGIKVIKSNENYMVNLLMLVNPDILLIHFIEGWMLEKMLKRINIPVIIWIHGYEALAWYRRLFLLEGLKVKSWYSFIRYIINNIKQLEKLRKTIIFSSSKEMKFIFVSKWMKEITEKDTHSKIEKYSIIANPIDTDFFKYDEKTSNLRYKILLIRPFNSKKYATDIAIKAISKLLKNKRIVEKIEITIAGEGKYYRRLINKIEKYKNVNCINRHLRHSEIKELHNKHGIFLCPTRQDSQGVSMCEAMSSGLVPITSLNSAIPEFVNKYCGFLNKNANGLYKSIIELLENEELFLKMSKATSKSITEKASKEIVIEKELKEIKDMILKKKYDNINKLLI